MNQTQTDGDSYNNFRNNSFHQKNSGDSKKQGQSLNNSALKELTPSILKHKTKNHPNSRAEVLSQDTRSPMRPNKINTSAYNNVSDNFKAQTPSEIPNREFAPNMLDRMAKSRQSYQNESLGSALLPPSRAGLGQRNEVYEYKEPI